MKKLERNQIKTLMGGLTDGNPWSCTFTHYDGAPHVVTLPNIGPGSGLATQCLCDDVCWGDPNCKNVDCAGSGACPY